MDMFSVYSSSPIVIDKLGHHLLNARSTLVNVFVDIEQSLFGSSFGFLVFTNEHKRSQKRTEHRQQGQG